MSPVTSDVQNSLRSPTPRRFAFSGQGTCETGNHGSKRAKWSDRRALAPAESLPGTTPRLTSPRLFRCQRPVRFPRRAAELALPSFAGRAASVDASLQFKESLLGRSCWRGTVAWHHRGPELFTARSARTGRAVRRPSTSCPRPSGATVAVHVITHARYIALSARDSLHAKLAAVSALEIINPAIQAQIPIERTVFSTARRRVAALAR